MKRTKNMIYRQTEEARELELYTVNDGTIYRNNITPYIENLHKKAVKGNYDKEKAVDGWYNIATIGAKKYVKEFCSSDYIFSVTDRFTVAVELEKYYKEQVFEDVE